MARFDMAADMAEMAQAAPNGETFFQLGITYSSGVDVAPDLVAAHKWFNLAAMKGMVDAARYRQEVAEEMSSAQIAEAQRAAREWLRTH
jgi:TPR repeat protein